jgi:hypothetical protein
VEGSGHGLLYDTLPAFVCRDLGKLKEVSVRIVSSWDFPNMTANHLSVACGVRHDMNEVVNRFAF